MGNTDRRGRLFFKATAKNQLKYSKKRKRKVQDCNKSRIIKENPFEIGSTFIDNKLNMLKGKLYSTFNSISGYPFENNVLP